MRIGIVADDLTGAADAVAPFAMRGLSAAVSHNIYPRIVDCTPNALALDTATRDHNDVLPTLIASMTRQATRRLLECRADLIYKKIDSTLRGFLRIELDAMQKELPGRLAVICPAFPANGRTIEQGILSINGFPQRSVRAAFEYETDEESPKIHLETLRQGEENLIGALNYLTMTGKNVVFCDAVHQSDLEILAKALLRQPDHILPVGSAGLSSAIAAQLDGTNEKEAEFARDELQAVFSKSKVLIVVGSQHSASRRQATLLTERAGIKPVSNLYEGVKQLEAGQRIALVSPEYEDGTMRPGAGVLQLLGSFISLSDFCLIATGGDTARQLLNSIFNGCRSVTILGESQPGIVFGRLDDCKFPCKQLGGIPIMLKAGGFGDDETLARCVGLV